MSKYAIVVTDTGMFPGVNGMLNALRYYGNDNIEFHYLFFGKQAENFANEIVKANFYPNFFPVSIEELKNKENFPHHPREGENVWYCKMYRYLYAIYNLFSYDAVSVFDADMQIVNDIMDFFVIADKTGKFLLPNNDYSGQEYDSYKEEAIRGAASPPLHNMPCFFKPSLHCDFLKEIPKISLELTLGDMSSLSHSLIRTKAIDQIIPLPNAFWVLSHFYNIKLFKRKINNKYFLAVHNSGDRINAFHRKWWYSSVCRKFIEDVKNKHDQNIALNNVKLFWEMTQFFNFECYHTIDWNDKWNSWPKDLKLL